LLYGLDVVYKFMISRNLEGFFAKQPNSRLRDTSAVGCGEERKGGQVLRILIFIKRNYFAYHISANAI
jgi:hypothetical protein